MVNQFVNYYQRLSKDFWLYNYLASLIYFLLLGQNDLFQLFVYPFIVALIHFANQYLKEPLLYQYIGYQALVKEPISLILTFFLNQIIWQSPIKLILILAIYIGYQNYKMNEL